MSSSYRYLEFHLEYNKNLHVNENITIAVFDSVVVSRIGGFADASLVNSTDAELHHRVLLKTGDMSRGFVVGSNHQFLPLDTKFLFAFDNVMGNGSTAVLFWFFP